jgi:SAM-dependent methyltransferase
VTSERSRLIARRVSAAIRWRYEVAAERAFDRRRGIDTAGVFHLRTWGEVTKYQPVHPAAFRDFLAHLPADRGRLTFVDYGSGRGRALFLAVEQGFRSAIGVEVEPVHHRVAVANLARYRGNGAGIRLVYGDARDFPVPDGPVVIFLYNPFPRAVLIEVLAIIVESLRADPRPAWVIYEAPLDRDLLDRESMFELVAERRERAGASPRRPRFAIYRTAHRASGDR